MRLCSGPGCRRVVPDGVRFCDECKPRPTENDGLREHTPPNHAGPSYRNGRKLSGAERAADDEIQREYMKRQWRETTRPNALARHPLCTACGVNPTEVIDHIIPARIVHRECVRLSLFPLQRIRGFHIAQNLTGLCHSCHNEKSASESGKDYTDALAKLLGRFSPGVRLA